MGNYTVSLQTVCEALNGNTSAVGYPSVGQLIADTREKIFDFDYPLFDETYRSVLETKILKHYFTRELCEETYGLWKLRLDTKMNEIMPYYNQLYSSELLAINPLYTVNYDKTHKDSGGDSRTISESGNTDDTENRKTSDSGTDSRNTSNTGTGTKETDDSKGESVQSKEDTASTVKGTESGNTKSSGSTGNTKMYSDTPQGALTNVQNGTYLTNATVDNGTAESESNNSGTNETNTTGQNAGKVLSTGEAIGKESTVYNEQNTGEGSYSKSGTDDVTRTNEFNKNVSDNVTTTREYVEHVAGNTGANESEMLMKYRATFLNIDMEIINELECLFFGLW